MDIDKLTNKQLIPFNLFNLPDVEDRFVISMAKMVRMATVPDMVLMIRCLLNLIENMLRMVLFSYGLQPYFSIELFENFVETKI